jgi:hypothetical protein
MRPQPPESDVVLCSANRQHAAGTRRVHVREHARSRPGTGGTPLTAHLMVRRGSTVRVRQRLRVFACLAYVSVVCAGCSPRLRRPRSVHQRPPWTLLSAQFVGQADRVFASVAGEVAVVAVDHGQACSWFTSGHVVNSIAGSQPLAEASEAATAGPQLEHRGGRVFASWTLISNRARAQLARSTCASPVPAPPPGSSA